jgi:hypothetical protein
MARPSIPPISKKDDGLNLTGESRARTASLSELRMSDTFGIVDTSIDTPEEVRQGWVYGNRLEQI